MKIIIEWQKPILLSRNKELLFTADQIPKSVPSGPGVYFFSRCFGSEFEPFYIGETGNLRARLRGHLKDADIRDLLRGVEVGRLNIKQGNRFFHYGTLKGNKAKTFKKCLDIVQRFMIEEAVAEKYQLLNSHWTKIKVHSVSFTGNKNGRAIFPGKFDVEA